MWSSNSFVSVTMAARITSVGLQQLADLDAINRRTLPEHYDWYTWYILLGNPKSICLGAYVDLELAGYIIVIDPKPAGVAHTLADWHIASIAVLPEYRRRGLARALISAALSSIPAGNVVDLFVRVDNEPALKLYKSMGFQVTRKLPHYYTDRTDAFVCELRH